jgi:hypothetical protein
MSLPLRDEVDEQRRQERFTQESIAAASLEVSVPPPPLSLDDYGIDLRWICN